MNADAAQTFSTWEELSTLSNAFEAEVRSLESDPNAPLERRPAKLNWTGRELVAHVSAIYRWCAEVVTSGGKVIREPEGPLAGNAGDWFAESRSILFDALSGHAPEEPAFTFQRDNRTVGFWNRRMVHETLVHLWDLRSILDATAPAPVEVSAAVHADGVSELFEAYADRVDDAERATFTSTLLLRATDTRREWLVGPEFRLPYPPDRRGGDGSVPTDATVSGPTGALLLFVWSRSEPDSATLTIDGDADVVAAFSAARLHP